MKVFDFDPADHSDHYAEHGWVHIKNGQSPEFHQALKDFIDREFGAHKVEGATIGGQKQQALYDFPSKTDFPGELFDSVAAVCGLAACTSPVPPPPSVRLGRSWRGRRSSRRSAPFAASTGSR